MGDFNAFFNISGAGALNSRTYRMGSGDPIGFAARGDPITDTWTQGLEKQQKQIDKTTRSHDKHQRSVRKTKKTYRDLTHSMAETHLTMARFLVVFRRVAFALIAFKIIDIVSQAFGRFTNELIKGNVQMELLGQKLTQFYGSSVQAGKALEYITQIAIKTPFEIPNLTQGVVQLKVFGIAATESLERVADVAAATVGVHGDLNTTIVETATRFGKVAIGSKRLAAILPTLGINFQEFNSYVQQGKSNLEALMLATEKFAGTAERLSRTLTGVISNIYDKLGVLIRRIGFLSFREIRKEVDSFFKSIEGFDVSRLSEASVKMHAIFKALAKDIITIVKYLWSLKQIVLTLIAFKFLNTIFSKIVVSASLLGRFFIKIAGAMKTIVAYARVFFTLLASRQLSSFIMILTRASGLWGIIVTAATALVSILTLIGLKQRGILAAQEGIRKSFERAHGVLAQWASLRDKMNKQTGVRQLFLTPLDDITEMRVVLEAAIRQWDRWSEKIQELTLAKVIELQSREIKQLLTEADLDKITEEATDGTYKLIDAFNSFGRVARKHLHEIVTEFENFQDVSTVVGKIIKDAYKDLFKLANVPAILKDMFEAQKRYNIKLNEMNILLPILSSKDILGKERAESLLKEALAVDNLNERYRILTGAVSESLQKLLKTGVDVRIKAGLESVIEKLEARRAAFTVAEAMPLAAGVANAIEEMEKQLDKLEPTVATAIRQILDYLVAVNALDLALMRGTGITEWDSNIRRAQSDMANLIGDMLEFGKGLESFGISTRELFDIRVPVIGVNLNKNLQQINDTIEKMRATPLILPEQISILEEYRDLLTVYSEALDAGAISVDTFRERMEALYLNLELSIEKFTLFRDKYMSIVQTIQGIVQPISNIFTAIISKTENFGQALVSALKQIISNITAMITQILTLYAIFQLVPLPGDMKRPGFWSAFHMVTGIKPFQHGGTVRAGQAIIGGERGAELFVPNQSGRVYSNRETEEMLGGEQTIIVPVNIDGREVARAVSNYNRRVIK